MNTTPIIIFYFLYFAWLFSVTYLSPNSDILNYFTAGISLFYMMFLREKGDLLWFLVACSIPLLITAVSAQNWQFEFNFNLIRYMPVWLPLAWGTTFVALRKFYKVIVG